MQITTCQFNDSYFPIMDGVGMTAHNYAFWLNEKYGKSMLIAPKVKDYKDYTGESNRSATLCVGVAKTMHPSV